MRPIPWVIRVGLFAVGLGAGLSLSKAPSTQRAIVIELRLADFKPLMTLEPSASEYVPCTNPSSGPQLLSAMNQ